jgi:hypothetical protein
MTAIFNEERLHNHLVKFCQENGLVGCTFIGFGESIEGENKGAAPMFITAITSPATPPGSLVHVILTTCKASCIQLIGKIANATGGRLLDQITSDFNVKQTNAVKQ